MGAYVAVVGYALKLFNYIAAALQQHHDELNGRNQQIVADQSANLKGEQNAAKAMVDTTDESVSKQLRDGEA